MAKDKLRVFEDAYGYYIAWWLAEDGEEGARLGDNAHNAGTTGPRDADRESYEVWLSENAAAELCKDAYNSRRGLYLFDTRKEASAVVAQINVRLRQDRPLPEWAAKALAEGWKPPKGWKA